MYIKNQYQQTGIFLVGCLSAVIALAACQQEGAAEKAGKKTDQAVGNVGKPIVAAQGSPVETAGEYLDDAMITTRAKAVLLNDELLKASHIEVTTFNGMVTLIGKITSEQLADRAINLVKSQEYVKGVHNELMISAAEPGQ